MRIARCRSCGAAIIWARTPSGATTPFDADAVVDGRYVLQENAHGPGAPSIEAVLYAQLELPGNVRRYVSHFTTCPRASWHSRKRAGAAS